MIVLDTLLIANSPSDGPIITAQFVPAEGDNAAHLVLRTLISDLTIEGDAALLLFNHYRQNGKRIGSADHATISREAVIAMDELVSLVERVPLVRDAQLIERCRSIVKSLKVQVGQ